MKRALNEKLMETITEATVKLYEECGYTLEPKWPWVLVKVLSKQRKVGSLVTPTSYNKVIYEGLVVATWKPFSHEKLFRVPKAAPEKRDKLITRPEGSEYKPGDVVIFPHFAGVPTDILDEREFRLVPEESPWDDMGKATILGKLSFGPLVRNRLAELFQRYTDSELENMSGKEIADCVLREFDVVPKNTDDMLQGV